MKIYPRIRKENIADQGVIREITELAFRGMSYAGGDKQDVTDRWFALGPVSVLPEFQGRGIGYALIENGLMRIKGQNAFGCVFTGGPEYYRRFGFELSPQHVPLNESKEYFMLKLFTSTHPTALFSFHPAFYGDS